MDENVNKFLEEVKESKYFDLLLEEKVRTKSIELIKRRKWLIGFIALVNVVVIALFGFKVQDFNNEVKKLELKGQKVDSLVSKYESMVANFEQTQNAMSFVNDYDKKFLDMERDIINEKQKFNEEARRNLQDMLTQLTKMEIKEQFENLNRIADDAQAYLVKLEDYKNSIDPKIEALSNISKEIKKSSSVRYLFVERGDKNQSGKEYRPAQMLLPFSKDTLAAVFHDVEKKNDPKRILVDVYLNQNTQLFEDLMFSDLIRLNKQLDTRFSTSEGNQYKIQPVFIYLPPNTILTGRIPDYVILEIRLTDI